MATKKRNGTRFEDFDAEAYTKKIDDLETFREEFSGKEFDKKVEASIKESTLVQKQIKNIAWDTIREKVVWLLLGALLLVFIDVMKTVLPKFLMAGSN